MEKVDFPAQIRLLARLPSARFLEKAASVCALALGLLTAACVPLVQEASRAQEPFLNLDFEEATPHGMPLNWYIEAEEAGTDVRVAIDPAHVVSGRSALRVTSQAKSPFPIYTPLFLPSDCAHAVILEGAVYAERPGVTIRPILFSPGSRRAIGAPVALTGNGWQTLKHQIVADPAGCVPSGLKIGLLLQGAGEAWIDGLNVSVDGRPWGTKALRDQANASEIRTLATAAVGLEDYSASAEPAARAGAASMFRSARVIALGENSHGADALFRMKFELIRFLVSEQGYRVLALEAPAATLDKVNDYVLGNSSDREAAIKALTYPSWKTEEMWRVVEWLRHYNQAAKYPVQFLGFDVQDPVLSLSAAEALVSAAEDSALAASIASLRRAMEGDPTGKTAVDAIDPVAVQIESSTIISASARQRLGRYMRTLNRGLRMGKPELGGKTRDAYMADQVIDMLDELGSGQKLILWADNTHVTRAVGAMGSFLADRLRSDYLSVGLTFNTGRYSAYGPERVYPVQEGFPGTHEYLLSQHRRGDYLVALALLPPDHSLRQIAGFRYIGSRPQRLNQFQPLWLEEHFDVLGFSPTTQGTHDLVVRAE